MQLGRNLRLVSLLACTLGVLGLSGACGDGDSDDGRAGGSAGTTAGTTAGNSGTGAAGTTVAGSGGSGTAGTIAGTGGGDAGGNLPDFDAGTDPNRNMVSTADLCERLSTIQCAGEAHCCIAPGRSFEQCKSEMKGLCQSDAHLDAIAADPITGFDAALANTAFTQFEDMAAQCDPGVASWGASINGLRGILRGTRAPGVSCRPQANFADPVVAGAALASCQELATHACLPRGTVALTWVCDPKAAAGGNCFTDVNCIDGLYCDNPDLVFGAECKPRKADGATCTYPNECASLFCKSGACVPVDQQAAYCLRN